MNFLEKIANCFSRKSSALKQENSATSQNSNIVQPIAKVSPEEYCMANVIGTLEYPAFTPQPLLSFYVMQKVLKTCTPACGDISMVEAICLFHPQTSAFICTAFAIKEEDGYVWAEIGSQQAQFSKYGAFIYHLAESFRIHLKQKNKHTTYSAVCRYRCGEIIVTAIVEEDITPPTDADIERFVDCNKLPCSLSDATEFVNTL